VKTVINKSHQPIKVPLPQGKVLHLGPNQKGQISHKAVDHEPLQKLVEEGTIEIQGDGSTAEGAHEQKKGPLTETHGHHPPSGSPVRGDR